MGWRRTNLTISSTGTDSPWLSFTENKARRSANLTITAPAALTGTVTIQKADDAAGTNPGTLQSPAGTDIAIAAGKSVAITRLTAGAIRIHSSGAEAADRTFSIEGSAAN